MPESIAGRVRIAFVPEPAPSAEDLKRLVQRIAARVGRSLERSGLTMRDIDTPRLFEANDHVSREIRMALKKDGLPIVPVLIGNARMPAPDELPDEIRDMSKRNAITLTDERWEFDVSRLMKVLSIDLANSVAQHKLDWMLWLGIALLLAGVCHVAVDFSLALREWIVGPVPENRQVEDQAAAPLSPPRAAGFSPLEAAIPFFGNLLAGLHAAFGAQYMEVAKRKYAWLAFAIAAIGTAAAFIYYAAANVREPIWSLIVTFCSSIILAVAVLACMVLARFKAE